MLHWYLINTFELVMAIVFLYAAFIFTVKHKKKSLGLAYFAISALSFGALYECVQVSGIMS